MSSKAGKLAAAAIAAAGGFASPEQKRLIAAQPVKDQVALAKGGHTLAKTVRNKLGE